MIRHLLLGKQIGQGSIGILDDNFGFHQFGKIPLLKKNTEQHKSGQGQESCQFFILAIDKVNCVKAQ